MMRRPISRCRPVPPENTHVDAGSTRTSDFLIECSKRGQGRWDWRVRSSAMRDVLRDRSLKRLEKASPLEMARRTRRGLGWLVIGATLIDSLAVLIQMLTAPPASSWQQSQRLPWRAR